jgi:hypothetical protein
MTPAETRAALVARRPYGRRNLSVPQLMRAECSTKMSSRAERGIWLELLSACVFRRILGKPLDDVRHIRLEWPRR